MSEETTPEEKQKGKSPGIPHVPPYILITFAPEGGQAEINSNIDKTQALENLRMIVAQMEREDA